MYKCIMLVLISLLGTSLIAADEAKDVPLTADAQALIDKATKDVAEAEAKFQTAKYTTLTALVDKLETAQERATKAGRLDAALAIKDRITAYQSTIADLVALRQKPDTRTLSDKAIGAWKMDQGYTITLDKAGTASWTNGQGRISGGWSSEGDAITIKWTNGATYKVTSITGDDMAATEGATALAGKRVVKGAK